MIAPSQLINPLTPLPKEWQNIPAEIYAQLIPKRRIFTPEESARLDKILASHWLLLVNIHKWKCERCGTIHPYFTQMCVERPFNRLSAIQGLIQQQPEGTRDLVLSGLSLGTIIPISEEDARKLRWKINLRNGYLPEWKDE